MTPVQMGDQIAAVCARAPVMPVLVVEDAGAARPLAEALVLGGLTALEVTLRTPQALEAIRAMAAVAGAVVGAGTLLSPEDVRAAKAAGAAFGVSPGATDRLLAAAEDAGLPLLPGAATATEAMRLMERGYRLVKFFPAEAAGGPSAVAALGGPLPGLGLCPTGGVGPANAPAYLRLSNVVCVGGSWVAPRALVTAGDWRGISRLAAEAAALHRGDG